MGNLVNAIIMGAQKCGTTTLYFCLKHHPAISTPIDPELNIPIKEIDFFFEESNWKKGVDWYKAHFKKQNAVYLDSSPNYLSQPIVYQRLLETCPEAKLVISLRNPVSRAYSQYNHYRQDEPMSLDYDWLPSFNFEDNIHAELADKTKDFRTDFSHFLGRGVYINQIELLLNYFDKSQIHFTIMERWKENHREELQKILTFFGVDNKCLSLMPPLTAHRHQRPYSVEPMNEEVKNLLVEFYGPYNRRLFDFLGYEIPEWQTN